MKHHFNISIETKVLLYLALFLAILSLPTPPAAGNTYYVNFEGGNDNNDGLSQVTAWKHAPDDPAATGSAAAVQLSDGKTVLFKGGVVYRGNILLNRSGTSGRPITYKGDGWGTAKAIIDGSTPYAPTWTRCTTAADCGGNPNFANIYYASGPAGYAGFQTALYENNDFLWYSQAPNPSNPFYHDEVSEFYDVPFPQTSSVVLTQTTVKDTRNLTQTSASAWNGAYVIAWVTGNVIDIKPVTSFNPSTNTLAFTSLSAPPYTDRTGRYGLMNHVSLIDRPGEYSHDPSANRIFLWPRNGSNPSGNQYSVYSKDKAFYASAAINNVNIEGFEIRHFTYGIQIENTGSNAVHIRNNYLHTMRSHNRYAIHSQASNSTIENNRVFEANRAVGILSSGTNINVFNNHVESTSRQGIWFMGARSSTIAGNTVTNILGNHSNGISIYSGSDSITVSGNKVMNVNSPITFEESNNISFINNIVSGGQISDWFGMTGTVTFYNNTFPRSHFYKASSVAYILRNNIVDSLPSGTASNNITNASSRLSDLFVNASANDFRLKSGSIAIDAGTAVPVTTDIDGTTRPHGSAIDIGAFEFTTGNIARPAPPTGLRVQ